jgi:nucleoside-diphosphate-sugar epimerase
MAAVGALRDMGILPIVLDLDDPQQRINLSYPWVVHLVPPGPDGTCDRRTRRLLGCLSGVKRLVYISTSGVYGDRAGQWIDETAPINPDTTRAHRRADAENWLRASARSRKLRLSILRVPGIYASDRLPMERLSRQTPAARREDDVYTNHVHADDLALVIEAALLYGRSNRVYHASDDEPMLMADYFDKVADAKQMSRPPRLERSELKTLLNPAQLSFMSESRRLCNRRMKQELGVQLQYPTVDTLLDPS